jgi:DNA-binding transcriptional regulator YbjK
MTERAGSRRGRSNDPERRDRIIDACLATIAEAGVAGASLRRIADAANVPLGSVSYHFASREELLFEAFTRFAASVSDRFDRRMATAADLTEARAAVVAILVEDLFGDSPEHVLTHELYTLAARDPAYRSVTTAWMRRSRAALERHFSPATASMLDALIEGLSIHHALDDEPRDPDEIVRAITLITSPEGSA